MQVHGEQLSLLPGPPLRDYNAPFVSTRFQGSKKRLLEWIWSLTHHLDFDSVFDPFGGTGAVSHLFKSAGKQIVYNDILRFNAQIARALIANNLIRLTDAEIDVIMSRRSKNARFITETFSGIYFKNDENAWIDQTVENINVTLGNGYKRDIAMFALYQACIVKRPYNLFHRANLYMRTANVERSFGNATTWEKSFEVFFRRFAGEANRAIFDNHKQNDVYCGDALDLHNRDCDLVYLDTPYVSDKGASTDYFGFYQFLEGLADYENWESRIELNSKHKAIPSPLTPWNRPKDITQAFNTLLEKYAEKIILVSYRDDGIPSIEDLVEMLRNLKKQVTVHRLPQKYVLSTRATQEVLIVAV